ncbi:MAG: hypothetical protein JSS29_09150 [Proteobacteria bacterium]|nr:hypothetical protein [Pseudomonadota bacterium]
MIDVERDLERIRDYIEGHLSEEEHRLFEDRLTRDPELVREVEHAVQLREGLRHLDAQGLFPKAAPAARSWFPRMAAAAASLVAVGFGLWLVRLTSSPDLPLLASPGAGIPVSQHFTFLPMRGNDVPELELPTSGLVDLRARPEEPSHDGYRVTLARSDAAGVEEVLGTSDNLQLGNDGYVHVYTDARRLKAGGYELRLESAHATPAAPQTFRFSLGHITEPVNH